MNSDHDDHLRDAFTSEANWSLDVASVQGRINAALDRRRRRNRAGAILGAGLAVGGLAFGVHALQPSGQQIDHLATSPPITTSAPPDPSAPAPTPSQAIAAKRTSPAPTVSGSSVDLPQRARDAYFAQAPKNDCCSQAAQLAALWQVDMFDAKALAGQIVLDGGSLSDATSHNFDDSTSAFFQQGYTITDAEQLAALWQEPTQILSVKAVAGRMLLDGKTLPIQPGQ